MLSRVLHGVLFLLAFCGMAALPMRALAQDAGVVVLGESDFERVPDAAPMHTNTPGTQATTVFADGEVHVFDPRRDASADIRRAVAVAARDGKHVLLDVGGNWCPFCKVLDQFFVAEPEVLRLRQRNFVYVKVNFSKENQNADALADFPLIRGFPHFFVLDRKGKLVVSQRVAVLGEQDGYSPKRFVAFLQKFGPAGR